MKNKMFILVAMIAAMVGCSKEYYVLDNEVIDQTQPEVTPEVITESDSTIIKFNLAGNFTPSPLTKASGVSKNDLYALQVYTEVGDGYGVELKYYAMGVYDDLALAVVKLPKNQTFSFVLAYIPSGKNVLKRNGSGYGNPCSGYFSGGIPVNSIIYTTEEDLAVGHGTSQKVGSTSQYAIDNWWNDIERYQGIVEGFDPNQSTTVSIELKSMMIGFNITIEDFESGVITLKGNGPYEYSVSSNSSGTSNLSVVIEAPFMIFPYSSWYATEVKLMYTDQSGDSMSLMNTTLNYEFNTMYNLTFSLSDAIANGGITATVINEDMKSVDLI